MFQEISIITVTKSRPKFLKLAQNSLINQTNHNFQWVVISVDGDEETENIATNPRLPFSHIFTNLESQYNITPEVSFSLSRGRNKALRLLNSFKLVTYLDDDNTFEPNFVQETIDFFNSNPNICFSIPRQNRRRDIVANGETVKIGKRFTTPDKGCLIDDLIIHKQLIDSNGFAHLNLKHINPVLDWNHEDLKWNADLKVYIDYEYFLKCVTYWGRESFAINDKILVNYVQTNQGVIGQSKYSDWADELDQIVKRSYLYPCLSIDHITKLNDLTSKYRQQSLTSNTPTAFHR
jgi:glycosyltransferase involved in cell wall biosynthesis